MPFDRFLAPLDIWRHGPLGVLKAEVEEAADRGDEVAFRELSERFWALYDLAAARRAVLGDESRKQE